MAKLFVANCTKQRHEFTYLVPEDGKGRIKKIMIPIGGQSMIHKEETPEILNAIVDQHVRYGLIEAKEIPRARAFIGLCFSMNKTIDVEDIMTASYHNDDVLEELGLDNRKTAVLAMEHQMNETVATSGGTLTDLEVSIREDTKGKSETDRAEQTITIERPEREGNGDRRQNRAQRRGRR